MKNLLKIGALSLALIATVFMLNTNAADTGPLTLEITAGDSTCVYGTSLDLGTHVASFAAFNMTGTFTPSTWSCTDNDGFSAWVLDINSTDLTNATSQSIDNTLVSMDTDPNQVTAGACATGAAELSSRTPIDTNQSVLEKSGAAGQICTISAANVQLAVAVPANQPVGLYTGTLTVTLPAGF